ncbi:MAG TPA: hypothetical protein VG651_08305 [Stellaceae bacterium]|nr:hypothetical protein [Stellaceae bacterium]
MLVLEYVDRHRSGHLVADTIEHAPVDPGDRRGDPRYPRRMHRHPLLTSYGWAMVCWIALPPLLLAWFALVLTRSSRIAASSIPAE